jgi:small subunit ribosomal protein S17
MAEENQEDSNAESAEAAAEAIGPESPSATAGSDETAAPEATATAVPDQGVKRAHRSQKVGAVVSDKMQKTVVVRVDRLVRHTKYRRYVRRTSKFMAHDELGATIGDKVRIVETRPMSARKRWRVLEIVQKAAK